MMTTILMIRAKKMTTRKTSSSCSTPEMDQRLEWRASWLRYVRSVIPISVSADVRQQALDAAEKLLRELDRYEYNAIVSKQLLNVVNSATR